MATVAIGGASGYWGEAPHATQQLLQHPALDYLVYDYLAEVTLSIMARVRQRDPALGYAVDFVTEALAPNLAEIAQKNVKVISNAGGMNPQACGAAVRALIDAQGLSLSVAVVTGDDLLDCVESVTGCSEMFTGAPFPPIKNVVSANAYLGALPIAQALRNGADIVITGRCVDSAVTLGACIAEFDWSMDDFDKLAQASLAGHLIECGPQMTGGNFTDWRKASSGLADIGYPVAVVSSGGDVTVTKPESTGGLVSTDTVAEQLVYEIHDPQEYILPDVICDFSQVTLEETGPDHVRVEGARGCAPPDAYKVSVTFTDGYKAAMSMIFIGFDAASKAQVFAETSFARADHQCSSTGIEACSERSYELIGADSQFGASPGNQATAREVQLNIAVKHADKAGISCFIRAVTGMGLATPAGMAVFQSGRPRPSPVVRLFSCAIDKDKVQPCVDNGVTRIELPDRLFKSKRPAIQRPPEPVSSLVESMRPVPLIKLALGRSGDKGDRANIGIIARDPDYLPWIWNALTPEVVKSVFDHFGPTKVERFLMPGIQAVNFVLHDVLGGGGMASIRSDAQGKAYAQILLHQSIPVPTTLAEPFE